jgi:alkanesulfonate monooxygenase SsuD/methylene tetrahydromethanopterin reductase-like flavin-dependent oxidoreductase (luciferase family)
VTVRAVETIDEISNGRFIFGFGSGHAGRQGEAFGFPLDYTVSRYEEALTVVMPLLRNGSVDFTGKYHRAVRQPNHPRGPQGSSIPVLLGGHGPRTIGLAVDHADIWSAYATTSAEPEAFEDLITLVDATCDEKGRDRSTLGRSVGIGIRHTDVAVPREEPLVPALSGTTSEIVSDLARFADLGFTSVEFLGGSNSDDIERLAPILAAAQDV